MIPLRKVPVHGKYDKQEHEYESDKLQRTTGNVSLYDLPDTDGPSARMVLCRGFLFPHEDTSTLANLFGLPAGMQQEATRTRPEHNLEGWIRGTR